ncbi:MAG: SO_0444 family Cu/Zn efflux transporter [Candidatus Krumholzibacteria bacterium]|nr:SO_0444 family Cu/Zn efflux transporter [Candidatus Krumholzibacteria bacterium]
MQAFAARFALSIWSTLLEMSPFLLFGFLAAGLLSILVKPELVERHLGGRGLWQVIKAAVFGVPLPLCSCGVIPVAASLRRHGAGAGATTSFLISTPQTGVDSIMVTLCLLGPVFAVFRPVVAFLSRIFGGILVNVFGYERGSAGEEHPVCTDECCSGMEGRSGGLHRALSYGFLTLPRDINRALLIGIVIAGGISAAVPDNYLSSILGGGIVSMLIMMAVGIPLYVCATASVPIAAALIAKGVSPGAALVFLMTGPATNAATVMTVWKIMGKRVMIIYLAAITVSALAAGLILDSIFNGIGAQTAVHSHWMLPAYIKTACAFILLAVLVYAFFPPAKAGGVPAAAGKGRMLRISITGMTCTHCAEAVRRALLESPGVASVEVDLKKGEAVVVGDGFDVSRLSKAVEDLGYRVVNAREPDRFGENG